MLFFTQKKLQTRIDSALRVQAEAFGLVQTQQHAEIEGLRADLTALRANQAMDLINLRFDVDEKLQALPVSSVQTVVEREVRIEPDDRIDQVAEWHHGLHQQVLQLDDTVRYLLEAPLSVQTVIERETVHFGVMAVSEQHALVRPMGVR